MNTDALKKLREPFPENCISLLPKPYKKDSPKGQCKECGGYHGLPAVHLKYVGHAALTDRLLDVDPTWTWEPLAFDQNGLPMLDKDGGMWINLTVCGVTRYGYGDAQGKSGGDAMKERIGDALRNAAMRFGAALDLWHKGDLHGVEQDQQEQTEPKKEPELISSEQADVLRDLLSMGKKYTAEVFCNEGGIKSIEHLPAERYEKAFKHVQAKIAAELPNGEVDA